ncbi:hypothetical protein V1525DRAFT_454000 [Lipomyces kononenkoae]|uniref:Uncharacterized protein n=1 Tax=Lipomyces kononenkoae TaxID=34357 RepID=A0ACC3TAH3_LIPKO
MASGRPSLALGNPAKYYYTPSNKLTPTTRADISTALLELLARLDVHNSQQNHKSTVATDSNPQQVEVDNNADDHEALDEKNKKNDDHVRPQQISHKAAKKQQTRSKKQQKVQPSLSSSSDPVPTKPAPRSQFWFEKYLWFVSSDGYLVLSGRYSQQSALLLTRHLSEHDVVVSAQSASSSLVVVKNNLKAAVVPPSTLSQAATLALSTSVAWDHNGLADAWWCRRSAVTVDTNVEDVLTVMTRTGRDDDDDLDFRFEVTVNDRMKMPIAAPNLVMGFGILFLVDEESVGRRGRLRVLPQESTHDPETNETTVSSHDEPDEPNIIPQISSDDESDDNSDDQESGSGEESDDDEEEEEEDEESTQRSSALSTPRSGSPVPTSLPRGKKSKLKKISTKYADQDDEDRALRMKILGSTKSEERHLLEQDKLARRAARDQELEDQKRKEEQAALQNRVRRKEATETQRVPVRADVLLANDADELAEIVPYDRLVARPARDDNLLAALPICAPWPALHKLKYKVKLLPGVGKRGKTVKKCQQYFVAGMGSSIDKDSQDVERCWPKEIFLIGGLTDTEISLPVGMAKFRAGIPNAPSGGGGGGGGQSANKKSNPPPPQGPGGKKAAQQSNKTQSHAKTNSSKKKSGKK